LAIDGGGSAWGSAFLRLRWRCGFFKFIAFSKK
jgi:hypothetical protein